MSDLIRIVDLEVWSVLGVPEAERKAPQRLLVTLDLYIKDIGPAAFHDEIKLSVDYSVIAERVHAMAELRPRYLLETLAEEIATDILKAYPDVKLRLEIKKFALPAAQYVSIFIERPLPGRDPSAYRPNPSTTMRATRQLPPYK